MAPGKVSLFMVPAGPPSCGGDVAVYAFDINQPSLPAPFYSVLVSLSVFMALSTVFHSINSRDNSPSSHSVLRSYLCRIGPYNYVPLYESLLRQGDRLNMVFGRDVIVCG